MLFCCAQFLLKVQMLLGLRFRFNTLINEKDKPLGSVMWASILWVHMCQEPKRSEGMCPRAPKLAVELELKPQLQSLCSERPGCSSQNTLWQYFHNENKWLQLVYKCFTLLEDRHVWLIFKNKCQKQHFLVLITITNLWHSAVCWS